MNTGLLSHIPYDVLESYALRRLPNVDYAPFDKHLINCPACQTNLRTADEYVAVMRAAIVAISTSARPPRSTLKRESTPSQILSVILIGQV
jgi:hypothetical protein